MAAFKGKNMKAVRRDVERVWAFPSLCSREIPQNDVWTEMAKPSFFPQDTIPLMINGWKLWPMVAFLNFVFVPVNHRIIVASIVGLFWGIYLSLFATLD
jgi:hypothetical protein